jgi:S1-C subfamily serine protease
VAAGSPAEKAGIARGDIILTVGDKDVNSPHDVVEALQSSKSGDSVAVKLTHGDATHTVQVVLEARDGRPYMGVVLVPPLVGQETPRDSFGGLAPYAALITEVAPGSPAAQAGLEPRDVVLSVDGTKLDATHSLGDLVGQHKAGDTVTLSVTSAGGQPRDVKATLAQNPDRADTPYLGVRYGTLPDRGDRRWLGMRERGPDFRWFGPRGLMM